MKYLKLLLITSSLLFANGELLKQAQNYEKEGNFKKAMELYKQVALGEKTIVFHQEESPKEKINKVISKKLDPLEDKESQATIEQMLSSSFNIYAYKENYFLPISYDSKKREDRKQNEAKFQLSIKKPFSYNFFGLNETINFGYTQTSWWQIYANSAPFRETNYQPEIFMVIPHPSEENSTIKGYKVGFIHESNGQGGNKSRSWNRLYLETYLQLGNLFITPQVWYRIPEKDEDDNNPDIDDYLGYGDLKFFYAYKDHTFNLLLRNNLKFNDENKGFAELNWTFPFPNTKDTFGFVQVSNGYGDSLIDYDQEISRFSFGISLSR